MRFTLEARPQPSRAAVWLAPLLATLATLIVGFFVFKAFGKDPVAAFGAFFVQPVATLYGVAELLLKATPLLLYTSDAADERSSVDLGGRRIIKKKKKT